MLSIFDSLDTNQDGRISQDEAQASPVVSRSFSKADANGDGAISRDEFTSSFTTRAPDTTPPPTPEPPR
jgi:Ca2+-binding EF-hand superfamily protein